MPWFLGLQHDNPRANRLRLALPVPIFRGARAVTIRPPRAGLESPSERQSHPHRSTSSTGSDNIPPCSPRTPPLHPMPPQQTSKAPLALPMRQKHRSSGEAPRTLPLHANPVDDEPNQRSLAGKHRHSAILDGSHLEQESRSCLSSPIRISPSPAAAPRQLPSHVGCPATPSMPRKPANNGPRNDSQEPSRDTESGGNELRVDRADRRNKKPGELHHPTQSGGSEDEVRPALFGLMTPDQVTRPKAYEDMDSADIVATHQRKTTLSSGCRTASQSSITERSCQQNWSPPQPLQLEHPQHRLTTYYQTTPQLHGQPLHRPSRIPMALPRAPTDVAIGWKIPIPNDCDEVLAIQSSEVDSSTTASSRSSFSSADGVRDTPDTSPSRSPMKVSFGLRHFAGFATGRPQLNGHVSDDDEAVDDLRPDSPESYSTGADNSEQHLSETGSDEVDYFDCNSRVESSSSQHGSPDDITGSSNDAVRSGEIPTSQFAPDEFTPLCTPSPAKGAASKAFPFPQLRGSESLTALRTPARRPSTLFGYCKRNATPRQKALLHGGSHTPDRFISERAQTPTKESLVLKRQRPKQQGLLRNAPPLDPFGPVPARSLRMAEQYATMRTPPPPVRPSGLATRVVDNAPNGRRAISTGAVWTVGGTMITEGITSITNGRGGRITSGTSAPHYAADFLRRNSASESQATHARRLAIAIGIDQDSRMLVHPSPSTPDTGLRGGDQIVRGDRQFKDGLWQHEGVSTPTNSKTEKTKDVPVIPFRVLNAPALRDDYYCSLLSYSATIQCLAVGLGPHVYLWSEKRPANSSIPDSLTAAPGSSHVTSVSFSSTSGGSAILAIGRADGRITLWSPLDREPRFDSDQPSPVSCLSFRPTTVQRRSLRDSNATVATEELLVGDEAGFVYYYSVEWPDQDKRDLFDWHGSMTLLARINCHSQQVCSIAWSSQGQYFATGGNDNQLYVFESKKLLKRSGSRDTTTQTAVRVRPRSRSSDNATVLGQGEVLAITAGHERHVFALNAAVKAVAFAPWQPTLIAAGGGSNDRCIHFFHASSGSTLATIDCHAQVTSLVWSEKRKEIAATFGFAQPEHAYRVAVFAWPSCNMVVRIPWWGEERALYAVAYPRGPTGSGRRARGNDKNTGDSGAGSRSRNDAEGRPWYGKRTQEEGCLVLATSNASIKFHEIWAEQSGGGGGKRVASGVFGGSQILEEEFTGDVERWGVIR